MGHIFLCVNVHLQNKEKKKLEKQRLLQQRDLDIKADAFKCWIEDYVSNLPSQRERD